MDAEGFGRQTRKRYPRAGDEAKAALIRDAIAKGSTTIITPEGQRVQFASFDEMVSIEAQLMGRHVSAVEVQSGDHIKRVEFAAPRSFWVPYLAGLGTGFCLACVVAGAMLLGGS